LLINILEAGSAAQWFLGSNLSIKKKKKKPKNLDDVERWLKRSRCGKTGCLPAYKVTFISKGSGLCYNHGVFFFILPYFSVFS
jgi:hypothetical protein